MATHRYTRDGQTFEIILSGTPSGGYSAWTVERVLAKGTDELRIPGIENIVASDENAAFVRACSVIDRWLEAGGVGTEQATRTAT